MSNLIMLIMYVDIGRYNYRTCFGDSENCETEDGCLDSAMV